MSSASREQVTPPLKAADVMVRLGFHSRPAFWSFVHREALPYIRLGARNAIFEPQQLEDFLARRQVGGKRA